MQQMDVQTYAKLREDGEKHLLLDVREADELAICQIDGHVHIPMNEIPQRLSELSEYEDTLIVCQCRSGHRAIWYSSFC